MARETFARIGQNMIQHAGITSRASSRASESFLQGTNALANRIERLPEMARRGEMQRQQIQSGYLDLAREEIDLRGHEERVSALIKESQLRSVMADARLRERHSMLQMMQIETEMEKLKKTGDAADIIVRNPGGGYRGVTSIRPDGSIEVGDLDPSDPRIQSLAAQNQQAAMKQQLEMIKAYGRGPSGGKTSASNKDVARLAMELTEAGHADSLEDAIPMAKKLLRGGGKSDSTDSSIKEYREMSPEFEGKYRAAEDFVKQSLGVDLKMIIDRELRRARRESKDLRSGKITEAQAVDRIIRTILAEGFNR